MASPAPQTIQQQLQLFLELAQWKGKFADFVDAIRTCPGENAEVLSRAEETLAALQRLGWALERELTGHAEISVTISASAGGASA